MTTDAMTSLFLHTVSNQPTIGDKKVNYIRTVVIGAGLNVDVTYVIDSGYRLFFSQWAGTSIATSNWVVLIDDLIYENLDTPPQSMQSWQNTEIPPEIAERSVTIRITNNGAVAQTYQIAIRGWLRFKS